MEAGKLREANPPTLSPDALPPLKDLADNQSVSDYLIGSTYQVPLFLDDSRSSESSEQQLCLRGCFFFLLTYFTVLCIADHGVQESSLCSASSSACKHTKLSLYLEFRSLKGFIYDQGSLPYNPNYD